MVSIKYGGNAPLAAAHALAYEDTAIGSEFGSMELAFDKVWARVYRLR
jgi:hypothetical protein